MVRAYNRIPQSTGQQTMAIGQLQPYPVFINKALLEQPHLFIYILSIAAFTLPWQCEAVTETYNGQQNKIFTI